MHLSPNEKNNTTTRISIQLGVDSYEYLLSASLSKKRRAVIEDSLKLHKYLCQLKSLGTILGITISQLRRCATMIRKVSPKPTGVVKDDHYFLVILQLLNVLEDTIRVLDDIATILNIVVQV